MPISKNDDTRLAKLKSEREKRGEISKEDLQPYLDYSTDQILILLEEKEAQKRTIAATLLADKSDTNSIRSLCSSLKNEKALYSRIAISETLSKIGEPAAPYLINLIGQIGNNHETELPKKYFNKNSYPLVRDMAARTLVNVGKPATPYLIEVLGTDDEFKIQQAIDALGGIAAKTGDHRALNPIKNIAKKSQNDSSFNEITLWKVIRAFGGFKTSENASAILLDIIKDNFNPPLVWETARSLGQIGVYSSQIIELLKALEQSEHPEINKAAKNALIQINV
jgi:HEAT repeat protein